MALSKTAERRLTKLVEYMESLPKSADDHFSMKTWMTHEANGHDHGIKDGDPVKPEHYHLCGTTACAMGHAAQMPYFKRLGLRMVWWVEDGQIGGDLRWNGDTCSTAGDISQLFDLEWWRAEKLFAPQNRDRSPKAWAARARKLMRKWAKEKEAGFAIYA